MIVRKLKIYVAKEFVINIEVVRHSADVMVQDTMAPFVKIILMSARYLVHHAMTQSPRVLILQAHTIVPVSLAIQVSNGDLILFKY